MSRSLWISLISLLAVVPIGINVAQDDHAKAPVNRDYGELSSDELSAMSEAALAELAARKRSPVSFPLLSEIEQQILSKLNDRTEVQFTDTPLKDAIEFLRQLHGIQIWIDEAKLAEETIDLSKPITLQLSGVTLRTVLHLLLDREGMTYVVEDEVLKITTITAAEEILKTRVYPIADLVSNGDDVQELMQIIQTSTGADSWEQDGGPGTVTPSHNLGALVIRQTMAVHDSLVELLQSLRDVPKCHPIEPTPVNSRYQNSRFNQGGGCRE